MSTHNMFSWINRKNIHILVAKYSVVVICTNVCFTKIRFTGNQPSSTRSQWVEWAVKPRLKIDIR